MDTEGSGLAQRRAELFFGKALVVEAVAGFVENAIEGDHEIRLVVTGGHAGVVGAETGAEGVGAGVESAGGSVEADFGEKSLKKLFLVGAGIMTG